MSMIIFFIWVISGILNLAICQNDDYQYWRIQYWITYGVLMLILLGNVLS